jgi:hypothetical protein
MLVTRMIVTSMTVTSMTVTNAFCGATNLILNFLAGNLDVDGPSFR